MPSEFATADTSSYNDPTANKLIAMASNDPQYQIQLMQGQQQIQQNQIKISSDQIALGRQKLAAADQVFGAIGANPTQENAQARIMEAVKAGAVDHDTANVGFAQLMPLGDDPKAIQGWAFDHLARNATYDQQLQNMGMGAPSLVDMGDRKVPVTPQSGPSASVKIAGGPVLQNGTTPAEKMGGVTTKNPDGSSTFRPNSTLYDSQGNFIGAGGAGSAPSIPVYRGAGGGSPPPAVSSPPTGQGTPPAGPAPGGQGGQGAPAPAATAAQGTGGGAPAPATPPPAPASNGTQPPAPATSGQGGSLAPVPAPGGTMTPNPQSLPVISADMARAALKAYQGGEQTAANRNILRGYAVQNNLTDQFQHMGPFEPQPAGVGAGVVVPPQPTSGQGNAPAPTSPTAAAPASRQAPMRQVPGSDGTLMERIPSSSPVQQPGAAAGLTVGLSPGQEASLKAGADGYSSLSSDVSNPSGVNQRLFQLRTALGALRNTQTGLGTAQRQQLVGYLASLPGGLAKWAPGVDPDSASSYDIATKYLTAYSLNTPGAARSDAGLSTAQSANANTSGMMQKAAQDVTLSNIGLENGKRALLNSFNASGADPGTFGKFASQWMQGADPRAFALPDMTPAERAELYSGLQGPAKAAFLATVKKGMAAKILSPNDLQGAAGNGQ